VNPSIAELISLISSEAEAISASRIICRGLDAFESQILGRIQGSDRHLSLRVGLK
jgi:hypothetical protein